MTLAIERIERLRRAAIAHRNCQIEAARHPHGKALTNARETEKQLRKALWDARDDIDEILRAKSFGSEEAA